MKTIRKKRRLAFGGTKAQKYGANVAAAVTSPQNRKDLLFVALGASLYVLVPTCISKFFKVDMSGIKGVLTGLGAGLAAAGFGGRGYAVLAGVGGALIGHTWYSQLNSTVVYPALGQYLWRWDPTARNAGGQVPPSMGDSVGMQHVTLTNGKRLPVYSGPPSNVIVESKGADLSDYVASVRPENRLSGYETVVDQGLSDYKVRLADDPTMATMDDHTMSMYAEQM